MIPGHPDMVGINAARGRLSLARQAGVACMAEDTAATIGAENSLEVALAHQIAAAHNAAMRLQAQGLQVLGAYEASRFQYSQLCTDAVKLMNASGRMMERHAEGRSCPAPPPDGRRPDHGGAARARQ